MFKRATKQQLKLRLMLEGASGSGKTTAALTIAKEFGKIALIDTERGSARLYSDRFEFDTLDLLPPFEPERFIEAIKAAEQGGYDVIVIDSITHEWNGAGGCLEIQNKLGGRYQDWAKVTPRHDRFVQTILQSTCHVICTCRSKQGYHFDESTKKVTKQGMEPEQRSGLDYEMTVVFQFNQNHMATALKDRTRLFDGKDEMITDATGRKLLRFLGEGELAPALVLDTTVKSEPTIDWKAQAMDLARKLGKDVAAPIIEQHKGNFEAMAHALAGAIHA